MAARRASAGSTRSARGAPSQRKSNAAAAPSGERWAERKVPVDVFEDTRRIYEAPAVQGSGHNAVRSGQQRPRSAGVSRSSTYDEDDSQKPQSKLNSRLQAR